MGCATLNTSFNPQATADAIAQRAQLVRKTIATQKFDLVSYSRQNSQTQPVTIYIEGDGRAWRSKSRLSDDPTPFHPLVLELAALDPAPNVVYLARPCQYARDHRCDSSYWSDKRFSEEVIASMSEAIDILVRRKGGTKIRLIGYSGGGAVAVLLAARRSDILNLRTVAGNLDPKAVNAFHSVSPISGSLDPMDAASRLADLPQRHFIGGRDKIIPSFVAENFVRRSGDLCAEVTSVPEAGHSMGWAERWLELLSIPVSCHE